MNPSNQNARVFVGNIPTTSDAAKLRHKMAVHGRIIHMNENFGKGFTFVQEKNNYGDFFHEKKSILPSVEDPVWSVSFGRIRIMKWVNGSERDPGSEKLRQEI